jgi:hypothetical protein
MRRRVARSRSLVDIETRSFPKPLVSRVASKKRRGGIPQRGRMNPVGTDLDLEFA